uniref:Ankyrin repeat and SOCS box containing 5 n=1 Tax=Gopherus evgoodei TaxID=1825980 RepID=A0A8C4VR07_9SAUR
LSSGPAVPGTEDKLSNVYFTILSLFCFKLFVKIRERKEAARIADEFYGIPQGPGSWADRSPLHEAASQGRLLSLKTLLSQGYSVDTLTIDHVTPLHEACLGDHVGCARILLEAGANVNATTIDGVTPLFNACSRGSASCCRAFVGVWCQSSVGVMSPFTDSRSSQCCYHQVQNLFENQEGELGIPSCGVPSSLFTHPPPSGEELRRKTKEISCCHQIIKQHVHKPFRTQKIQFCS